MKKISLPDLLWFFILIAYAGAFLYLLVSGKINDFLHPRMLVFTIGAVVVFFIIAGCQLIRMIKKRKTHSLQRGFLIFIIPLLFGFAARNIDTSTALAAARGGNTGQNINPDIMIKKYTDIDVRNLLQQSVIEIEDASYYKNQFILYENAELFAGKKIQVVGFMYRDKEFKPGLFLCARYIMWCCAADAVLTGYVSEYPGAEKLKPDTWLKVDGILDISTFFDDNEGMQKTIPKILVNNIEYIDPPKIKYIFAK
jgi:putative membrane protein